MTSISGVTKTAEVVFSVNIVRQNYNEKSFEDLTNRQIINTTPQRVHQGSHLVH